MLRVPSSPARSLLTVSLDADLIVVGGGLAGVCAALTAARAGVNVILVQDRPVLGGNASSEVRLWGLGATSHGGNNNRWAREGGVINEILLENLYRNPEGNPIFFDTVLLEKVAAEARITLLLNTAIDEVEKGPGDQIAAVRGFCSQNQTEYVCRAPLFCDASGDGIVGFLSGAAFRIGCEDRAEFDEAMAPEVATQDLLGHTIYFYSKDTGRPVSFVPPEFALLDITKIPRWREIRATDQGCTLWWIEWGGELDTIHETERIKWQLWKVAYGFWNHVKNSGQFPEAANLTLEWIGTVPGKRESRRFEGDYMLTQRDIVEQRVFSDAVSFGGWAIDLHPVDGVFSDKPGCTQWHSKGVYQIPYRCLYSRNIPNLFLAGRIVSSSHVAFGSTRVMLTCAHSGQAVGMAAALASKHGLNPRDFAEGPRLGELQSALLRSGQYIPGIRLHEEQDLAHTASVRATSEYQLRELAGTGEWLPLHNSVAMMVPVDAGATPEFGIEVKASEAAELRVELRQSSRPSNHTPDRIVATESVTLASGECRVVSVRFGGVQLAAGYAFLCMSANPDIQVRLSEARVTGVLRLDHRANRAVAKAPVQMPPEGSGVEAFEFWVPERRPGGKNLALRVQPAICDFRAENIRNGVDRPVASPNAWVAAMEDPRPTLVLQWPTPQTIDRVEIVFDPDFDHPMESVQMKHPERISPFCVQRFVVKDDKGIIVAREDANHQWRCCYGLSEPISTTRLEVVCEHPSPHIPAAVFAVRVYAPGGLGS